MESAPWRWTVRNVVLRQQVTDIFTFSDRPESFGIDIEIDPEGAARIVDALPASERDWAPGYLDLRIGRRQAIGPPHWSSLCQEWSMLTQVGVDLLSTGSAEHNLADVPVDVTAEWSRRKGWVEFSVGDDVFEVPARCFLSELVKHARAWCDWNLRYLNDTMAEERRRIAIIEDELPGR